MSKKATEFQRKAMSRMYRGKEIFKPLNTGWIDENVACVREWVANIFFYRKGDTTIMVDAGYNYDRLAEKMGWLGIDPKSIHHILITHQDTDHVGAVEADSPGLFQNAKLYIGEIENRYLTGEAHRKVIYRLYKLPQVTIHNGAQRPVTVIELVAPDRPGLLAKVGRIFLDFKLSLQNAKIATLGERVEDVFFVTDAHNQPLSDPQLCQRLQEAIVTQLSADPGAEAALSIDI